jgi:glyoxylate reductase
MEEPKPRVFVNISMHPAALKRLEGGAQVSLYPTHTPMRSHLPYLGEFEGMITYVPDLDEELFSAAKRLKVIACHSCPAPVQATAARHGVRVTVVPSLWDTVADMTLALMFAAARNIPQADAAIRRGEWDGKQDLKVRFSGQDIFGKTLGILGLGRIGTALARRVRGFDMKLLYHDLLRKEMLEQELHIQYRSLPALLAEADILAVLVPIDDRTRGLLGEAELRSMKKTAILVNTARGAIIDPQALYRALHEGWITAAGLDVFPQEPVRTEDPLLSLPNVVLAPHLGGSTQECDGVLVEDTLRVLQGLEPLFPA